MTKLTLGSGHEYVITLTLNYEIYLVIHTL